METEMSSLATAKVATREAAAAELRLDGENKWAAWRDHDAIGVYQAARARRPIGTALRRMMRKTSE